MNNEFKELDSLLKGFVEGTFSDLEQKRFEEILKKDSAARQRYLDYMAVESMLSNHKVKLGSIDPGLEKHRLKIRTGKEVRVKKSSTVKKRSLTPYFVLAASMLFILTLGYYFKFLKKSRVVEIVNSTQEPIELQELHFAEIEQLSGTSTVLVKGNKVNAREGMSLENKSEINTSANSEALIRFSDGTSISLAPNSRIVFSKVFGQFRLDFKEGFLKADVNKQDINKPLQVLTPRATLTVLGTILRVNLSKNQTLLTVDEGKVEMKNRRNQRVIVHAHESAVENGGAKIHVRNLKEYKVNNLKIISAVYGAEDKWVDVSQKLRIRAGNSRLIVTGDFTSLAGDPIRGIVKTMKIEYEIDGKKGGANISEYTRDVVDTRFFTKEIILPDL